MVSEPGDMGVSTPLVELTAKIDVLLDDQVPPVMEEFSVFI